MNNWARYLIRKQYCLGLRVSLFKRLNPPFKELTFFKARSLVFPPLLLFWATEKMIAYAAMIINNGAKKKAKVLNMEMLCQPLKRRSNALDKARHHDRAIEA